MNKYSACVTFYKKVGRGYENMIAMGFVVAYDKESAYKKFLDGGTGSNAIINEYRIGYHIEMEIPINYLDNLMVNPNEETLTEIVTTNY